ncbi:uncharacterized abhydrolase domain-containing protein DDB_G0269086 isoform X1 [Rosa chinensis]|uniref:uncharacterized abhydrolase domain-containing protein DDB_G0269086 isoform X1 n=1 Tax=Rosa chinensis TaxID=74649 RepID=UPI000D086EE8|nr:uncharacterized abhydrolase domain-containing protein DDB_G0269086 isoform X1 [Rosa chinensis]
MGLRMLAGSTEEDEDEAQIQTISEMIAILGKGFDGVGEAFLASGAELHRDFEDLSNEYAALEEMRNLELLVVESEYRELDEKHRVAHLEMIKVSKKFAALERKYKFELLKTFEAEEKCAGLEVKIESEVREKQRAEEKCREAEKKHAFEVSENAKLQKNHAFLWDNYQFERMERLRIEERCKAVEQKHELEVSEKRRAEEKYAELEERYELERLDRLNVEHEYKVLDEKHQLLIEEKRKVEKECAELEGKNEILVLEKLNAEDECKVLEAKKGLEVEGSRQKVEKEYAELWERHKLDLLEKVRIEIMYKELEQKHHKVEEEYKQLGEKVKNEEEYCKEVAEKYRFEVMEKQKVEEKYDALVEKYRVDMLEILKEYSELQEKLQFQQQENLKIKRKCEVLEEKIEFERLLRAQESEEREEKVKFDKKYAALQEKYEFEMLENLKIQNEYKELVENHRLEILAKINAESELEECKARLEGLKEQQTVANERYERLLEEVKKGRKAEDKEVIFECQRENNNFKSQNAMHKEMFELQASGLDKLMDAKSLDSGNKEKSFDHVTDLEDVPDSMPASAVSPQNGGLQSSGTLKFSSGHCLLINDSDDACALVEKKRMGFKRKRDSSPNTSSIDCGDNLEQDTIPTTEMRHHQKLSRCGSLVNYFSETFASSAVSDYGKQNKSASHAHIILGAIEKARETQKSSIESPAMASNNAPIDCDSDDSSTSIFSSDDSEDEDGIQSMLSAIV